MLINKIKRKKHILIIFCITIFIFGLFFYFKFPKISTSEVKAEASWYDPLWLYRIKMTINYEKVESDETNFPVLVSTTNEKLVLYAQSDGDDILFTSSDGTTKLDHEIEKYNSIFGQLTAWVETNISSATNTVLYMYYGNDSCEDQSNPASVWDSGYKGVYHLPATASSTYSVLDSTSNNNDGTPTSPVSTEGKIDGAWDFDGADDYIVTTGDSISLGTSWTFTGWFKTTMSGEGTVVGKKFSTATSMSMDVDTGKLASWSRDSNNVGIYFTGSTTVNDGGWHHGAVVRDDNNNIITIYLDGSYENSNSDTRTGNFLQGSGNEGARIGSFHVGDTMYFDGLVDEVRISNTARSAQWIKTEYNNQFSPATFITWGDESDILMNGNLTGYAWSDNIGWISMNCYNDYTVPWKYRKKIIIDHNKVDSENQTNFPVLVSIIDSDLMNYARSDGFDIVFMASNGITRLKREIEKYDNSTGALVSWVKVPNLSYATDTEFYIYYGSDDREENDLDVWDSGYKAVYHLPATDSSPGSVLDSTSNNNDGTPTSPVSTEGKIDGAWDFDGSDDYIVTTGDSISLGTSWTFTGWFKTTMSGAGTVVGKKFSTAASISMDVDTSNLASYSRDSNSASIYFTGSTTVNDGGWHHGAVVRDDDNNIITIYLDGSYENSNSDTRTGNFLQGSGNEGARIGSFHVGDTMYFDGLVDEVRISNTARSAQWIKTEYNNQSSPATFMSLGAQENIIDYGIDGILESQCTNNGYSADYSGEVDAINSDVSCYAWSENAGWLRFGAPGPYPEAPDNSARYNSETKEISGWAKILSLNDDGWVKLQGPAVTSPSNYALCRSCSEGDCDFCYELSADDGSGKIGTDCSSCAGAPFSCGSCVNSYLYGVSALSYSIKDIGNTYILEGWAWNGDIDKIEYNGSDIDQAYGVAVDSNDNIIVTGYVSNGSNYDYKTIKYDSNGNELWSKTFDGGNYDMAYGVAVDSNDNIIVTGQGNNSLNYEYRTIKYDSNGNVLWSKRYGGAGTYSAKGVAVDSVDNIIVTGSVWNSNYDYGTIKYDSNGNVLWSKVYNSGGSDSAAGVAVDSNDNIIVTGNKSSNYKDYYTIKYDSNGNELWNKSYNGGLADLALAVAVDSNDNIIVTGKSQSGFDINYYTIKYDSNGNVLWNKTYGGIGADSAFAVAVDSNDNIIVTGQFKNGSNYDYGTIKYDSNGNELWNEIYNAGGSSDMAKGIAVDSYDNIIVTGFSGIDYTYNYVTVRYYADGNYFGKGAGWMHFNYAWGNTHPPMPFGDLSAFAINYPNTCSKGALNWGVSSWANRYEIKRSDDSDSSQDCSTADYSNSFFVNSSVCTASSCSYQDNLEENKYYCYKVFAWNDVGSVENSDNPIEFKMPLCPPEELAANGSICGEISLSWETKENATGYKVYSSLFYASTTPEIALIATLDADATTYKDEDIIPNYNYYYLITALTDLDESSPSTVAGKTTCYKGAEWDEK